MSELTGISVPNISRIEAGKQNLSYQMMYKLVNALGGKILLTAQANNCIRLSNAAAEKLQELSKEANVSPEEFLVNLLQKASEEAIKV